MKPIKRVTKKLTRDQLARLEKLRSLIDKIDCEIVKLLNARAYTAIKLGKLKKKFGCPIRAKQRELEVLELVRKRNRGVLDNQHLIAIYRAIIAACRDVQKEKNIHHS